MHGAIKFITFVDQDISFFESSKGLKGKKRDLYEGGIRAPFIAVWPNKIAEGSVTNHISTFWDVLPTITAITNIIIIGSAMNNKIIRKKTTVPFAINSIVGFTASEITS